MDYTNSSVPATQVLNSTTYSSENKKVNPKTIIIAIFGLIIVISGVFVGVTLVQRQQKISKSEAATQECLQSLDCVIIENPGDSGSYQVDRAILNIFLTGDQVRAFDAGVSEDGCYQVIAQGDMLTWEKIGSDDQCDDLLNIQVWLSGTTSQNQVSAQCQNIKFYDTDWVLLTQQDLENLSTGDTIRISVTGTTSQSLIDKARFTISGVTRSAVTSKKPGSDEFYDEYIIPEGTNNLNIKAELHHAEAGWF